MRLNKRESVLFTLIMCFCMVFWMALYNVARQMGHVGPDVLVHAWLGFVPAYVVALAADMLVAGPLAKAFAFKYLIGPNSSPRQMVLAVSSCMVVPMVLIMSLYGCLEAELHLALPAGEFLVALPGMWAQAVAFNFVMALPWNLLVAGPVARKLFRMAFPEGTVHEEPVLVEAC